MPAGGEVVVRITIALASGGATVVMAGPPHLGLLSTVRCARAPGEDCQEAQEVRGLRVASG